MCVVGVAAELEVRELVCSPVAERNPVVNLQPVVATADDTHPVAAVYLLAQPAPRPAARDFPPLLPRLPLPLVGAVAVVASASLAVEGDDPAAGRTRFADHAGEGLEGTATGGRVVPVWLRPLGAMRGAPLTLPGPSVAVEKGVGRSATPYRRVAPDRGHVSQEPKTPTGADSCCKSPPALGSRPEDAKGLPSGPGAKSTPVREIVPRRNGFHA